MNSTLNLQQLNIQSSSLNVHQPNSTLTSQELHGNTSSLHPEGHNSSLNLNELHTDTSTIHGEGQNSTFNSQQFQGGPSSIHGQGPNSTFNSQQFQGGPSSIHVQGPNSTFNSQQLEANTSPIHGQGHNSTLNSQQFQGDTSTINGQGQNFTFNSQQLNVDPFTFHGQGQNSMFNSQQLHVDTSSFHGQPQNTSNTNYVSSTMDGNQWTNQFVQPYQMHNVYNNFQLNSTPNEVSQNSNTHPNFNSVRNMGTPVKRQSFTSSPPINQLNNQYSFGNSFRQDNFATSGMFHSERNPSHYYPSMSHNQNNMMPYPNCTTHCNCCRRFGNDVNTNSGVYSPQFIPANYSNTHQSENSWNTTVSNSIPTPGTFNYSSQLGTDQWQGQSNYPSSMIGNHWNDHGSSLMTRQQQLNYGSHMVQNQWNTVGLDQFNSRSNVNSFPWTQNQHTFNQSTNPKFYTNQLHGNREGFNFSPAENNVTSKNQSTAIDSDGFRNKSRQTYMQSNGNGSSTQVGTQPADNVSGELTCNSTPAHNQKAEIVTNEEETFAVPLDLSTSTHYSLDMANDSKNNSKSKNKGK